ncbi:MAG TPA: valine--tRNA ligase [Actinomycetota bacterium]
MTGPATADRSASEPMATAYDAAATEARLYAEWLERGYFRATADSGREPFCIVIPPPNVTGALHIGHALEHVEHDMVVRRKRMQGYETLWLPGTDHAGIATQVVVERQLAAEGADRHQLGRERFIERVWQWKEQFGGRIVEQMQALGDSCDWSRLRFTMDDGLARAVRVAFVGLYEAGLIYRGERLVNWCPKDTTSLSDSEVEHEDVDGELITFAYELSDGSGEIQVATTRIETMLGDTGVAVHPDDGRYADLVGKTVRHPFTGQDLPIVADAAVDSAFGTGALKITPAHDPVDFEIGQRHDMPLPNILTATAHLSDTVPEEFRGLDRYEARARVFERLEAIGRIRGVERPYPHPVGHCYRCHTEIEPWLSGLQWFVKVDPLKVPAKQAALDGRITFHPDRWLRSYTQWLDDLRDWNISRQLWWGHRIPVWYCLDGHQTAAVEDPDACAACGSPEIEQDPDVLDTWFSSQLWPFSTLGWPEQTDDLAFFYPTSLLITGYEILYLWVARMIMSGLFLTGDVPFRNVVIHGLVRDAQGVKMSKSRGNIIDPLDEIAKAGADALRFGLAYQATEAQNIPFGPEHIDGGRRFANKIWNAARLVLEAYPGGAPELPPLEALTMPERWLLARHQACLEEVDAALDGYRFSEAAQSLHRFFWSEFCDWGLELGKAALRGDDPDERRRAGSVLAWVLERSLRLLHPIMPFVTEEIWRRFGAGDSIVVAPWPEPQPWHHFDEETGLEDAFGVLQDVITTVRRFRSDYDVPAKASLRLAVPPGALQLFVDEFHEPIQRLAGIEAIDVIGDGDAGPSVKLLIGASDLFVRAGHGFDPEAARGRIAKQLADLDRDRERASAKLSNPGFAAKAPPEVRRKQEAELEAMDLRREALTAQLEGLG